jgi:hypothetical protein
MSSTLIRLCIFVSTINAGFSNIQGDTSVRANTANHLGLSIGGTLGYFRDLNYAPLNYRQGGTILSAHYTRYRKNGQIIAATVDYTTGRMTTDASSYFTTPFIQGNVGVAVLFPININKQFKTHLGPSLNSFFEYMQWGDEMDSWNYLMVHGLSIKGVAEFEVTRRKKFISSVMIPLLNDLVRPPYNGFDEYIVQHQEEILRVAFRGTPATFSKYIALDWTIKYYYSLSTRIVFQAGYVFRYQHVFGSNRLTQFQNQFSSGFDITF